MKPFTLTAFSLIAFGLAACGGAENDASPSTNAPETAVDISEQERITDTKNRIGKATGTIRSVGSEGDFLTIEHGPFEGDIQMGAMTMGFDTMGDVDLSDFADGDEVAFIVKQGRDGSYRIMGICNTAVSGDSCLQNKLSE
jgi:Cu/Ag efflux protein CusF